MNSGGYTTPLRGVDTTALPNVMQRAMVAVAKELPPKTGVIVFAFDFGGPGGGLAYIANANREDCIAALKEWIAKQEGTRN